MKKLLLLTVLLAIAFIGKAQVPETDKEAALQLLRQNSAALGLSASDISGDNAIVGGSYVIPGSNVRMVYLQQAYQGIPVYNQVQVLAFQNNKVVSNTGSRLGSIEKLANIKNGVPAATALTALQSAFSDLKITPLEQAVPVAMTNNGRHLEFGKLGITSENITADLLWYPKDGKENVRLVWQVFVTPLRSSDYWLVRVDAATGAVIAKENLTVTCSWDNKKETPAQHFSENHGTAGNNFVINRNLNNKWEYKPFVVNSATYKVIKYPAESPQHPGGTPADHTDPWLMTPGNATSLKWHYDGTVYHDSARGNNVWAQEDRDNNNSTFGLSTNSTTPQPTLTFPNLYDFTLSPTEATLNNQKAAITNLFYWNNLMHDMSYAYGFDEVGGNFQNDNQGRGGAGGDYVIADAQDAGGTNNANFATPADGSRPRMQMYLFTTTSPQRDGDLDAGVVTHEYGHGISNRLTGGPANASCLGNAEEGGEGWSDYMALMMTTNWATATVNDGPLARPMGTYVLGQPTTGAGIRNYPYSTNMAINPLTYANMGTGIIGTEVHNIGEIWCMAIWEMTWEIIKQDNAIDPTFLDPGPTASMVGNASAMKLVIEGMRLQPCSPGFIDARNAILKADTLFFNKKYSCAIWKAFAKRGMGRNASQGSSNSATDQVADFTVGGGGLTLNTGITAVLEGQNIVYTQNIVTDACTAMTNYTLRDTLPSNVTYVSGGSYDALNRVVSFNPVTIPANSSAAFTFTVNVNVGSYFPPTSIIDEQVTGATIPAFWTETSTTATHWVVSNASSHSAPNSFFAADINAVSDQILATTSSFALGAAPPQLTFWHNYALESGFDGAVLEISTNGGTTWTDLGSNIVSGGYNGTISVNFSSPIAGRSAWTGSSGGWVKTVVNLTPYANQANVKIRFREASDNSVSATGWYVDDIALKAVATVDMRSSLFDNTNSRVLFADTTTLILPASCTAPAITAQPSSVVRCSTAGNGVFSVTATGTLLTYQWEVSANNGTTWTAVPGATSATYTITNPTSALNGNIYHCVVTGFCGTATSTAAAIYVSPALTHTGVAATPNVVCAPGSSAISGTANGGTTSNVVIASSGRINTAIPDNDPAGVASALQLPSVSIPASSNLKLRVNLSHTSAGDVIVKLTSPCGTTYAFDRPGVPATATGNDDDLSGTYLFDLAGATVLPEAAGTGTIAAGTYKPSDVNGAAHNWAGLTFPCGTSGTWTLTVSDNNAGETGTLVDWALVVAGNYSHNLSGPGTIVQNAPTGANNQTGNFSISAIPAGIQTYTLTSTDVLGCSVVSTVNITSTGAPNITANPQNRTICAGVNTSFSMADNAPIPPTYQWQVSSNGGGTWINLANVAPFANVNTPILLINGASVVYNGYLFRCVVTNPCGTSTTTAATLTVNPLPVVNAGPSGICAPVTLTANGTANTYAWTPTTGLNTSTGTTVIANPAVNTVYTVTGTITATGCNSSASVNVLATPPVPVITPSSATICAGNFQQLTASAAIGTATVGSGSITVAIPDNSAAGISHALAVSGIPAGATITSVSVNFNINHTWDGDVVANLKAPNGAVLNLVNARGGSGDNFVNTTVSSTSSTSFSTGTAPFTGTFAPDAIATNPPTGFTQTVTSFAGLYGTPNGNWTLGLRDIASGDLGTLTSWSITINYTASGAVWTPATGLWLDAAGTIPYVAGSTANTVWASPATTTTYTVLGTTGTCNSGNATVTVTVNPKPTISASPTGQCAPVTLTATGNSDTYTWSPATGLSSTTGASVVASPTATTVYTVTGTLTATGCTNTASVTVNGTPPAPVITPSSATICLNGVTQLTVTPATGASTTGSGAITVPIPDNNATGTSHAINVTGIPAGATITGITVNLNITHTWDADVVASLKAPNGAVLNLINARGSSGDNFTNTNITSALAVSLATGTAPFTGTYAPDGNSNNPPSGFTQTTNNFIGLFTSAPNGTWTLGLRDVASGDVGTLTSWSVTINYTAAAPVWTPITGLFTNATLTTPYVAGTGANVVWAKPATTTTYTVTRPAAPCTSAATTVTVNVIQPATITTQPANQSVCQGANATFTVVSGGNFQNYQWQVSTNGGTTWTNVPSGAASLVLPGVTTALSGNQYRVIVSNTCSTVTSNAATLTVNATPAVSIAGFPARVCISDTLVNLLPLGTPVGGSWSGIGVSGFNFIPSATAIGQYNLTYSYTSSAGCTNTASVVAKVEECPERIRLLSNDGVILFPNPNNGNFNIRVNSVLYNNLNMKVFTSGGLLVRNQEYGGLRYGRVINIDLTSLPAGIYMVRFYYNDGARTSEKAFKVIVGRP